MANNEEDQIKELKKSQENLEKEKCFLKLLITNLDNFCITNNNNSNYINNFNNNYNHNNNYSNNNNYITNNNFINNNYINSYKKK